MLFLKCWMFEKKKVGTLAELVTVEANQMNERLRQAHEKIDGIVERAYQQKTLNQMKKVSVSY